MTLFYIISEENNPVTETAKLRIITETVDISHILFTSNDQLKFDHKDIRIREWEKIRITLKHTGILSKEIRGHNFVLLAEGTDINTFAKQAGKAEDRNYIPAENVIAHTKLIGGGESASVEFYAPAKGSYDFICSFPGSDRLMRGKFVVE